MKKQFRQRRNQPSVLLNTAITFPQIRLIDPNGAFIGIVDNKTALAKSEIIDNKLYLNRMENYFFGCKNNKISNSSVTNFPIEKKIYY